MSVEPGSRWVWLGLTRHKRYTVGKSYAVSHIDAGRAQIPDDTGYTVGWLTESIYDFFSPVVPFADTAPDVRAEIADEAKRIVSGARRSAYGTPEQNFERIARFWQAYFENTGRGDVKITAADVSPLMRLVKEARLCETPNHRDSHVDLIGYTLTGAEVAGVKPLTPDKSSDTV